jgi:phospholipid-binding lipoprotein MlaA
MRGETTPVTTVLLRIHGPRATAILIVALLLVCRPVPAAAVGEVAPPDGAAKAVTPLADPLFGDVDGFEPAGFPDPLEPVNRGTLRINRTVDRWLIDPIARTYRWVVPDPARRSIRNLFDNVNAPAVLANDVLQREWRDGGTTVVRFMLNTTVGLAGLFDPAADLGYARHDADFGQTLALEGVASGPFLVLPLLGPTTVRDGIGTLVDLMFRPTTYLLGPADQILYASVHGGGNGLVQRDANAEALRALEDSSIDYYAALRNAYYQHRTAQIWERREPRRDTPDEIAEEEAP